MELENLKTPENWHINHIDFFSLCKTALKSSPSSKWKQAYLTTFPQNLVSMGNVSIKLNPYSTHFYSLLKACKDNELPIFFLYIRAFLDLKS